MHSRPSEQNAQLCLLSQIEYISNHSIMTKKILRARRNGKPAVLSMFSGCGGMDLGFREAGFEIVWANDIMSDACETYRKNIGEIIEGDIGMLDPPDIKNLDVLIAGFPCQAFSNAGSRGGIMDPRGILYRQCIRFIETLKPKVVLFENVRGLLSIPGMEKRLIEEICDDLVDHGYEVHMKLVNASHYGVPQNRIRVIIVGISKASDIKGFRFPEHVIGKDLSIGSLVDPPRGIANRNDFLKLNPQAIALGSLVPEGGSWKDIPYNKLPERLKKIRKDMRKYRWPNFFRRFHRTETAGTITAAFKPENAGVWHPFRDRVLSAREIARIQSFPDNFEFVGSSVKAIYEMIGNAVPPLLGKTMAEAIYKYLAGAEADGPIRNYFDVRALGEPIRPGSVEMIYLPLDAKKRTMGTKLQDSCLSIAA